MTDNEELKLINKRIAEVKQAGYGSITIKIQDRKVVYIERTIGEQIGKEEKEK